MQRRRMRHTFAIAALVASSWGCSSSDNGDSQRWPLTDDLGANPSPAMTSDAGVDLAPADGPADGGAADTDQGDTSADAAPDEGSPAAPLTPDEVVALYNDDLTRRCSAGERCRGYDMQDVYSNTPPGIRYNSFVLRYADATHCREEALRRENTSDNVALLRHEATLRRAVGAGEVIVDRQLADACREENETASCKRGRIDCVERAAQGQREVGQSCLSAWSCKDGATCYSTSPGTCAPGICSDRRPCSASQGQLVYCDDDEYCRSSRCEPRRSEPASCQRSDECAAGLTCAPPPAIPNTGCIDERSRCSTLIWGGRRCRPVQSRQLDELCFNDTQCADGLICAYTIPHPDDGDNDVDVLAFVGRCVRPVPEGKSCDKHAYVYVSGGYRNNYGSCAEPDNVCTDTTPREQGASSVGTCLKAERVAEGGACEHDYDCQDGLLCPGYQEVSTCTRPPTTLAALGESCRRGEIPCQQGLYCSITTGRCEAPLSNAPYYSCRGDACPGLGERCDSRVRGATPAEKPSLQLCREGVCARDGNTNRFTCQPDPCL